VGAPCSGATPACLAGACVLCSPAATQCDDEGGTGAVQVCTDAGAWGGIIESCADAGLLCLNGACVPCSNANCNGVCENGICIPSDYGYACIAPGTGSNCVGEYDLCVSGFCTKACTYPDGGGGPQPDPTDCPSPPTAGYCTPNGFCR
jgi:hypothetical protein